MNELYAGWTNVQQVLDIYANIGEEKAYIALLNERRDLLQQLVAIGNIESDGYKNSIAPTLKILGQRYAEVSKQIDEMRGNTEGLTIVIDGAAGTEGGGGLRGLGSAAKDAAEDLDDMGRAMDLIDAQFKELDEAEARHIAGLDKISNGVKDVSKTIVTETDRSGQVWGNWIDQLTSRAFDGFTSIQDMFVGMIKNMVATAAANTIKIAVGLAALGFSLTFFNQVFRTLIGGMDERLASLLGVMQG